MKFKMQTKWRWFVAIAAVFVPAIATGALTLPYTFTSGTAIRAAEVNGNFTAVKTKVDALEVAKPVVLEKYDASVNVPASGSSAWITGTAPTSVAAGSRVFVHHTMELLPTGTDSYQNLAPCYRVGTTLTLGNLRDMGGSPTSVVREANFQDVYQISTAGSYEFGLCGGSDYGNAALRGLHTAAIIFG